MRHGTLACRCNVIAFEVGDDYILHQPVVFLCHGRRSDAQLLGHLLALETLYQHHLQDDGRAVVAAQHVSANLIDRVAEVLGEVVVGHVETQAGLLHSLLEALQAVLLIVVLQAVEQHEAEAVDHPRLQRQPRLTVLQLPEVVLVEREIIFMGDAVEVQSVLPFQLITLIIDMVGDAANAIKVVTGDLRVAVSQSFNDRFVGQSDSGTCVLLFFHLDANLIKILVGT